MQALGLIETRGLLAAVESADVMLKAAEVTLVEKTYVGGGLVSIAVTGDVGAVTAAVEAGTAAVRQINSELLVSKHVIPRPHEELDDMIGSVKPLEVAKLQTLKSIKVEPKEETSVVEDKRTISIELDSEEINKFMLDQKVLDHGLEEVLELLNSFKVTKLRNLAREYEQLGIAGRMISKADKKTLLTEFNDYYSNKKLDE
ncbi:BMC domain-containing protein [Neobacillus massiliamazoniensis]|uniref:Microcompartments protein n=1 Tax=Neobacillus massiliamazoniensis TaxID=1499688 RepID=A0A0U1NUT0_9BACI|nr:microcompartments protein [Neobacillus massiliamazoniensis]